MCDRVSSGFERADAALLVAEDHELVAE